MPASELDAIDLITVLQIVVPAQIEEDCPFTVPLDRLFIQEARFA